MKKSFKILALGLLLALTSCGNPAPTLAPTEAPTETPTVAPTETPTETPTEAPVQKIDYTINVKYEDDTPVVGARVQCCTADNTLCHMPSATDDNGVVKFNLEANDYVVHILGLAEGFYYDEDGYVVTPENPTTTIYVYTLKEVGRQ